MNFGLNFGFYGTAFGDSVGSVMAHQYLHLGESGFITDIDGNAFWTNTAPVNNNMKIESAQFCELSGNMSVDIPMNVDTDGNGGVTRVNSYLTKSSKINNKLLIDTVAPEQDRDASSVELIKNGTFDYNIDYWTALDANVTNTWDSNLQALRVATNGGAKGTSQYAATEPGKRYSFIGTSVEASMSHMLRIGNGQTPDGGIATSQARTSPGSLEVTAVATGNTSYFYLRAGEAGTVVWDDLSSRQILPLASTYKLENETIQYVLDTAVPLTDADRELLKSEPEEIVVFVNGGPNPGFSFNIADIQALWWYHEDTGVWEDLITSGTTPTVNWTSAASDNADKQQFGAQRARLKYTGGIPTGIPEGILDEGNQSIDSFVGTAGNNTIVQYIKTDSTYEVRIQQQDSGAQTATLQVNRNAPTASTYIELDGTEQGVFIGAAEPGAEELERIVADEWSESEINNYLTSKGI